MAEVLQGLPSILFVLQSLSACGWRTR